jgi:hypothetical protein
LTPGYTEADYIIEKLAGRVQCMPRQIIDGQFVLEPVGYRAWAVGRLVRAAEVARMNNILASAMGMQQVDGVWTKL